MDRVGKSGREANKQSAGELSLISENARIRSVGRPTERDRSLTPRRVQGYICVRTKISPFNTKSTRSPSWPRLLYACPSCCFLEGMINLSWSKRNRTLSAPHPICTISSRQAGRCPPPADLEYMQQLCPDLTVHRLPFPANLISRRVACMLSCFLRPPVKLELVPLKSDSGSSSRSLVNQTGERERELEEDSSLS